MPGLLQPLPVPHSGPPPRLSGKPGSEGVRALVVTSPLLLQLVGGVPARLVIRQKFQKEDTHLAPSAAVGT